MEDAERKRKAFVGYEYKEVTTETDKVSFLIDSYENFGWELDENMVEKYQAAFMGNPSAPRQQKVTIRMKRDRKIINKMELTRLQRNFEACVREVEQLENSKTLEATIYAIIIGILGTAFMAGSVFAVTADPPRTVLSIIFAIPAFIGWILPCIVYKKMVKKRTEKLTPIIEEKYDEIYEICEKGNKLLN